MNHKLTTEEMHRLTVEEFRESEKLPLTVVLDNVRSLNNIGSVFRTSDAFRVEHIALCGITATPPHREIHKTALGAEDSVAWSYHEDTAECVKELKRQGYKIYAVEIAHDSIKLGSDKLLSQLQAAASQKHTPSPLRGSLAHPLPENPQDSLFPNLGGEQGGPGRVSSSSPKLGEVDVHRTDGGVCLENHITIVFGNEIEGVQEEVMELCDGFLEIPQSGTKHSLNVSCAAAIAIWELYKLMKL